MKTINERLAQFVDHIGGTLSNGKGVPEVAKKAGLDPNTLRIALRPGASKPSYDTITAILKGWPALSAEWLMLGDGDMLKWGGAGATASHTPGNQLPPAVPSEAKPYREGMPAIPGTASPKEVSFVDRLIRNLEEENAKKDALIEWLQEQNAVLLGKSPASAYAAAVIEPRQEIAGFRTAATLPVEGKVIAMWAPVQLEEAA